MFENIRAYSSYIGGFLTHLVMGSFYLWGNLSIYVASFYRYNGYPDIETSTVQEVFPLIYFGMSIGFAISIPICRRVGHKLTSAINMIVYCTSNFLASISNFYFFVIL